MRNKIPKKNLQTMKRTDFHQEKKKKLLHKIYSLFNTRMEYKNKRTIIAPYGKSC